MRCVEFEFIAVSSIIFAFNATLSTFAIKQNDVLFVFFDNVKNVQEEKNIFDNAIELIV